MAGWFCGFTITGRQQAVTGPKKGDIRRARMRPAGRYRAGGYPCRRQGGFQRQIAGVPVQLPHSASQLDARLVGQE